MREVSCRPVKSDDEILTGAPRCNLILTFLSRSIPDTGRGEVLAVRKTALHSHNKKWDFNLVTGKNTLLLFVYENSRVKRNQGLLMSVYNYLQTTKKQGEEKTTTKLPNPDQRQISLRYPNSNSEFPMFRKKLQVSLQGAAIQVFAYLPAWEVGVRGVGGATSCVLLSLPEAVEGNPRTAGFRVCLNLSSRSRLSRSASSAALLAPYGSRLVNHLGDYWAYNYAFG